MTKTLHIVNDLIRGGTEGQCARVAMGLGGEWRIRNARKDTARLKAELRTGIREPETVNLELDNVHRVAVFRREGFFLEQVEEVCGPVYEVKVRHLVRFGTLKAVWKLRKWILDEKFDVVHTWDAESSVFGGLAAVLAGVPLITSRRDLGEIYSGWKTCMLRWADSKAVKVVVNAEAIGRHFVAQGLDVAKVCRIPNVMDLEEFDGLAGASGQWSLGIGHLGLGSAGGGPQIAQICTDCERGWVGSAGTVRSPVLTGNAAQGAGLQTVNRLSCEALAKQDEPGTVNFICVSRMDPEKDHECLVRAFAGLVQDSGLRLFLVGDGVERERLEGLCSELKISDNVVFLGERSDVPAILSQMDVGILIPKANEGLSNSILEYMAAGLPVVCSDCGGNAELVKDGENGFVVPISDENAVFLALDELRSEEIRRKMGENGRNRVENEFSMNSVLNAFDKLYEGITDNAE